MRIAKEARNLPVNEKPTLKYAVKCADCSHPFWEWSPKGEVAATSDDVTTRESGAGFSRSGFGVYFPSLLTWLVRYGAGSYRPSKY
jgi:hypothetical protein